MDEHINVVQERLDRLKSIQTIHAVDRSAASFINELDSKWQKVRLRLMEQFKNIDIFLETPINHKERCISPSDFGFHNALLRDYGKLCFIDFEYAVENSIIKSIALRIYNHINGTVTGLNNSLTVVDRLAVESKLMKYLDMYLQSTNDNV